jgi:D-sedoheptulose 7-phosphate isomerase
MVEPILGKAIDDLATLLKLVPPLGKELQRLADMMIEVWSRKGKVLICGNGGSSADAMHFAEELSVRYMKNRRALNAMALSDPTVLTCAGNDLGFERIFSRQVEAYGNEGDLLIVLSTSGNSANLIRAVEQAKSQAMKTCALLGRDGGKLKGQCDIELIVGHAHTARIQEVHKLLYHVVCEYLDTRFA